MTRQFKGLSFSGDGDFSGHESVALHKRLDEGLSILSGGTAGTSSRLEEMESRCGRYS